MRKWALLYSAAVVAVVGCGGSGNSSSHSSTTTTTTTTKTGVAIKLTTLSTEPPGAIDVAFLTGQGRAPGDLTAVVTQLVFDDNYGEVTNPLAPQTDCVLAGFADNIVHLDVPFATQAPGVPSRIFTTFTLNFLQFDEETDTPVQGDFTILPEPAVFPKGYPATVRVFPGRTTSLPIFIDDSMFTIDATNANQVDYNESQFLLENGATAANPITGFLSDMISFNLNKVTNKPTLISLATNSIPANDPAAMVLFSGDVYAVADGTTSGANYEALTLNPTLPIAGLLGGAGSLTGPSGTLPHPGTYSLLQLNPTDLTQTLKIVAGQGIWRQFNSVLVQPNGSALAAGSYYITMPSSSDNNFQEFIAFTQDSSANISQLYYGYVDLTALTFTLYPVANIMSGSPTNPIDGTLGTLYNINGAATQSPDLVHSGTFSFNASDGSATAATKLGFGNGTFYVFRL